MFLAVIAGFVLLVALAMSLLQDRLIYYPSVYAMSPDRLLPPGGRRIDYPIGCGRQSAFYLPPRTQPHGATSPPTAPKRLWVFFNGNASLALDFLDLLERHPDPEAGCLLIEYPGYAACEGQPTPATILESSEKALQALAGMLGVDLRALTADMNVFGYSLGAAAALQFAARHEVNQMVLIAPFTSLMDMARRTVGWPLCHLLRHRFDNRARLAELASRPRRPRITIFHGTADGVVPVRMGRELAGMFPGWIEFHELPNADHIMALLGYEERLLEAMAPGDEERIVRQGRDGGNRPPHPLEVEGRP